MPVSADTLALLMAKGLSGADLVEVVRAIDEDGGNHPVRTLRQERNRRYYESQKAKRETSENVLNQTSEQDAEPPQVSPPKRYNQTPSSSPPSSLRSVRDRARDAFPDFWSAYPRREGSNPKQPAEGKFVRLVEGGEDPAAIIDGAKRYAASVVHAEPRFTAQALTWLNQGRWRDDHRPSAPHARAGPGAPPQRGRTVAEMAAMNLDDDPDFFHDQQPRTDTRDRATEVSRDPHESRSGFAGRLSFEAAADARRSALVDH